MSDDGPSLSELRLAQQLLASAGEGLGAIDAEGRCIAMSPEGTRLLGYDRADELLGRDLHDLVHHTRPDGSPYPPAECSIHRARREGRTVSGDDEVLIRRDGSRFPVEYRACPIIVDGETRGSVLTFVDITARRHAEAEQGLAVNFRDVSERARAALAERESRLAEQAALLDAARDAIVVRDLDHRITYWNASASRLYGYALEEVLGRSVRDLLHDDPAPFDAAMSELLATGGWNGELRPVTRTGTRLLVEARWTLVRDEDGTPRSVLAIGSDVTERRAVEQQLLRTQRLESLGTLAGGIAHDLNNVLAPILLAVQSLQLQGTDPATENLLAVIEQSTLRGAEMVRQVLSFARGVDGQRSELDVGTVLAEVARIVHETFPEDITVELELREELWPILGDATQLHQVVMNLCVNARDAMADGGTLLLDAENVAIGDASSRALGVPPGRYVTIRVEDDGTGMEPAVVDRLFEPFFTTKGPGEGTGLGLPTSHGIVTSHRGFLRVDSEPGRGSTFEVFLPALPEGVSAD